MKSTQAEPVVIFAAKDEDVQKKKVQETCCLYSEIFSKLPAIRLRSFKR